MGAGGERGSYNQALRKEEPVRQIVILEKGEKFYFKRLSIWKFYFACKRKKFEKNYYSSINNQG